jgi:hypothetical protein
MQVSNKNEKAAVPGDDHLRKFRIRRLSALVLVKAGALDQCTKHGAFFGIGGLARAANVPLAVRLARAEIDSGVLELPEGTSITELMATIVGVYDECSFFNECSACATAIDLNNPG